MHRRSKRLRRLVRRTFYLLLVTDYFYRGFLRSDEEKGNVDEIQVRVRIVNIVKKHLLKFFPWNANNDDEMFERQQEMVISPEIVQALGNSPKRERDETPKQITTTTPKKVRTELRKIR